MELPVKISWFTGILFFNIMGPLQAQNNTFRILNQELALKLARNANLEFLNQKIEFEYKFTSSSAPGEHRSELNNRLAADARITSYNVCYTKLLRTIFIALRPCHRLSNYDLGRRRRYAF